MSIAFVDDTKARKKARKKTCTSEARLCNSKSNQVEAILFTVYEQSAAILTTSPENVVLVNFVIELKIEHLFTCSSLLIMLFLYFLEN